MDFERGIKFSRLMSGLFSLFAGPTFLYTAYAYFVIILLAAAQDSLSGEIATLLVFYCLFTTAVAVLLGVFGAFLMMNYYTDQKKWAQNAMGMGYFGLLAIASFFLLWSNYTETDALDWTTASFEVIAFVCFGIATAIHYVPLKLPKKKIRLATSLLGSIIGIVTSIISIAAADGVWTEIVTYTLMLIVFLTFLLSNLIRIAEIRSTHESLEEDEAPEGGESEEKA